MTAAALVLPAQAGGEGGMPNFTVTALDLTVIIAYLLLSRIIPLVASSRMKKKAKAGGHESDESEDYFLGGRNFIWPFVALSLVATNMSGATFVGLAGGAYEQGISIFAYEWMSAVILVIFVFFILPFYLRSKVFTLPEYLEKRYDRRSRMAFAGFNLFANMFIDMAAALFAGAVIVKVLYPGIPMIVSVAALALLAAIYTVIGGLGAVMISDSIQATVTLIGGVIVLVATFNAIESWDAMTKVAGDEKMSLILPPDHPDLPWPGLITGVLVIGLYYWTTNQLVVQRTLGARSLDHGRWGSLFAGLIKLTFLFLFILPGVMALSLYPELEESDTVFPTLVFDLLPVGLRGLILAAVIAAITSTVDSILNSASTIVTMDFVKTFRPDTSQRKLVFTGRVATVVALVVAIVWAPFIGQFDTLYEYLQSVLSFLVPPVVVVFLAGIAWKRISATAAFTTLVVMQPLGVVGFVVTQVLPEEPTIQFLYASGISLALSVLLIVVVSLVGPSPDEEKTDEFTWKNSYWTAESKELKSTPVWANYRYLSIGLLAVTAVIVVLFA
ncbi:sodium:solute symporter [Ornithinimicrobium humiphilum]|uniref:SSS family solute:Na+ symporter n=1 Tax=Ornithinimicrobium humiphilum TaxID=125288 RepID=A0A543KRR9_9MICO|nr:sodium/solute symporter [Ornithinimicrobium humiphilum]TQM97740.1 SSS family solute:Na+ symporter [Ornithinimicrobium humiphilum]